MISIPCPAPLRIPPGYVIARINLWECTYVLHWLEQTSQVLVEYIPDRFDLTDTSGSDPESHEWILQMDGRISESIYAIVNCNPERIRISNWKLTSGNSLPGDYENFLDCTWSDYAVDKMSVEFDLRINPVETVSRFTSPAGGSPIHMPQDN
jgi:hypothetical protein